MKHGELVDRAEKWLRGTRRCVIVVRDYYWFGGECPDAMGWEPSGQSTLIECKASRADFLADKGKPWRRVPSIGLGDFRFYLTPKGLVNPTELPDRWGLLEVYGSVVRQIQKAQRCPTDYLPAHHRERRLLVNVVRRVRDGGVGFDKVAYVEAAAPESEPEPREP